jgi:acyl-CoA dehydrogenase
VPGHSPFNQAAPALGNQYRDDRVLCSYLKRQLPPDILVEIEPNLLQMGELAGGELYRLQLEDRLIEPVLTSWNAWGERVDSIRLTPLWQRAEHLAAQEGVVAAAYEPRFGRYARLHQFSLAYLFHPSTDVYTCPLAMTDGAARTLLRSGNRALIDRAVPHLISRDPARFWTSGQWMTETTGGSDVGRSETVAQLDESGTWRLWGRKWFTSAVTSQIALALARPEGNPLGGRGLALFYLEPRGEDGRLSNIVVNRLKDKLGTRKLPTAELSLEGVPVRPVLGLDRGVSAIVPMLQLTRTWNSVTSAAAMRRALALAGDYARKRVAFGAKLSEQPLHLDTLAGLQAEAEAAFHLSFFLAGMIGKDEAGDIDDEGRALLRILTSIVKLTTARQAVDVVTEAMEAFGGAGYVEDTGIPALLRDSHVFPIWEGTTNVLSLDVLRALRQEDALQALVRQTEHCLVGVRDAGLAQAGEVARNALSHAADWVSATAHEVSTVSEAGARRLALTLGRCLALALLVDHAQWALEHESDLRPRAAARRFAASQIDLIASVDAVDAALLVGDANEASTPTNRNYVGGFFG